MKFKQLKNGDCDIIFNDIEIKILNKHKKISLSASNFRDFSNNLMRILAKFYENLPEKEKHRRTESTEINLNK